MANIQDKITKQFPEATFEDGEILLVNIPDAKWHDLAKFLKEDEELIRKILNIIDEHPEMDDEEIASEFL